MKTQTLNIEWALKPFTAALGDSMPKLVNDIRSMLGRVETENDGKNVDLKTGDWKATSGFAIKRTDGTKIQLPPNNPATILICFGMRLNELAKAGDMVLEASVPEQCKAWVKEHTRKLA